jgi:hypothetical protein
MEVTELITRLIEQLREQIEVLKGQIEIRELVIRALASGFVFLATVIGMFFHIYRKDRRKSDERFYAMHNDMIVSMNNNTESNISIRNALDGLGKTVENNSLIIKEFPMMMKDTIYNTINLARQKK